MPINNYDELAAEYASEKGIEIPKSAAPAQSQSPYDDLAMQEREKVRRSVQGSFYLSKDKNPEMVAKAQKLADEMNLPASFVERNYDAISKEKESSALDYDKIIQESPGLSKWLTNPDNAAIAKDDLNSLSKIDKASRIFLPPSKDSAFDFPFELGRAAESGWNGIEQSTYSLGAAYGKIDQRVAAEAVAEANKRIQQIKDKQPDYMLDFNNQWQAEGKDLGKAWEKFTGSFERLKEGKIIDGLSDYWNGGFSTLGEVMDMAVVAAKNPRGFAYSNMEQLANMAPSIVARTAGGIAGAAAGTPFGPAGVGVGTAVGLFSGNFIGSVGTEIGAWINQSLSEKGYDLTNPDDIMRAYSDQKLMSGIIAEAERKGLGTAAVDSLLGVFAAKLGRVAPGASATQKVIAKAGATVGEMLSESGGEAAGQLAAYKGDLSKVNPADVVQEGLMAGGSSVVSVIFDSVRDKYFSDPAKATEQVVKETKKAMDSAEKLLAIKEMGDAIQESKLAGRLPEKIAELVDVTSEGSDNAKVFFQVNDFDSYWNSKGESPAKAAENILQDGGKAYHEAKANGTPLEIPLSAYAAKVAPIKEDFDGLLNVARVEADGMTLSEIRQYYQQLPTTMSELAKEAAEEKQEFENPNSKLNEIKNRVSQQIQAAGVGISKATADSYGTFVARRFNARSKIMGVDPVTLFEQDGLEIMREDQLSNEVLGRSFKQDALFKSPKVVTLEAVPGPSAGLEVTGASPAVREQFTKEFSEKVLTLPDGKDAVADLLGLTPTQSSLGKGAYAGDINSNIIASFPADTDPALVNQYARIVQYVAKQEAVPTFKASADLNNPNASVGILVTFSQDIDSKKENAFYDLLRQELHSDAGYTKINNREIVVINFRGDDGKPSFPNESFLEGFKNLGERHGKRLQIQRVTEFRAEDDYGPVQNWGADSNTDALLDRANPSGSPIIKSWLDSRSEVYRGLLEEYSGSKLREKERILAESQGRRFEQGGLGTAPPFYSKLIRTIESKLPNSTTPSQVLGIIKDVKAEERKWSGIDEFLKDKEKVTKEELLEFLRGNQLQIKEVTKNEAEDTTKFSQYVLPGGENYKELLFTLPQEKLRSERRAIEDEMDAVRVSKLSQLEKNGKLSELRAKLREVTNKIGEGMYSSSHFDESNVLAHTRFNERVDADGKRVLFIEEIQSDWHQAGRKKGYESDFPKSVSDGLASGKFAYAPDLNELNGREGWKVISTDSGLRLSRYFSETKEEALKFAEEALPGLTEAKRLVPDAPFKKTWHEFVLKRMIRYAAENGFDKIAWTTGEQQAERYDLSKQVDAVRVLKNEDGTYDVEASRTGDSSEYDFEEVAQNVSIEKLSEVVGKDLAEKISKQKKSEKTYEGVELKFGGEGMKGFYDKILVDFANKFGKKFGAKVEETKVPSEIDIGNEDSRYSVTQSDETNMYYIYDSEEEGIVETFGAGYIGGGFETEEGAERAIERANKKVKPTTAHSLPITDELKNAALSQGFELFQDGPVGPRGSITFLDKRTIIALGKAKDPSTFIHELGHFFLDQMARDVDRLSQLDPATLTDLQKQFLADANETLKYLGVDSFEKIAVEQHETFAISWEAYGMEGKSPSAALKRVFAKFKVFITSVYLQMRNLNVSLTPEIRGVFDRMIATQEEIRSAEEEQNMAPLFADPAAYGMTGKKAEAYITARQEYRTAADERLRKEVLKDIKRQQSKEYKERRAQVEALVAEEVAARREYRAIEQMRNGKQQDGSTMKLSKAAISEMMGTSILAKLPRPHIYTADGGMHPDVMAGLMGFESGEQMLRSLVDLPKIDVAIKNETDRRMAIEFPDSMSQEEFVESAMIAIHNDQRAKVLRMELEHMVSNDFPTFKNVLKKTIRRVPSEKIVREHAKRIIGTKQVKDLKPNIFLRAEARAAKDAANALTSGDFDAAFEAKQKELLNHELFRATIEAKENVKKKRDLFKKIFRADEDIAKTRDMNFVNAARAILAQFGLGKTDKPAESYLKALREYDPDGYTTISALIESATERVGQYKEITYDDFTALAEAIDALWSLAKESKEIEIDGKKMQKEQAIEELSAEVAEMDLPANRVGYDKAVTSWDKVKMGLLGLRAMGRRVESWTNAMDLGGRGPFTKYIWEPISEAATTYRIEKKKVIEKYLEIIKPLEKSLTSQPIRSDELGYTFKGKAELLGAILHSGNESNLSKLLRGRNWGSFNEDGTLNRTKWDSFINRMWQEGVLTKDDYDFAQKVWDLMEEMKPGLQRAHKRMYGHYFSEVTANEIVTPFGVYKGGYVPAKADPLVSSDAAIREEKNALEGVDNSYAFPTTGRGATKSRIEAYAAPLTMDLRFIPQHIDWAMRFTHIEPMVKQVARIVVDKKFRGLLDRFDPAIASDMITPWLQRSARQVVAMPSKGMGGRAFDTIWRELRSRTSMGIMAGNVINALQQFTGLSVAAVKVDKKRLLSALWTYSNAPKETTADILEKSKFMSSSLGANTLEIQEQIDDLLLNPSKYEKARAWSKKNGQILQGAFQGIVNKIVWMASYDESVAAGVSEAEAVKKADSDVRLTQGSFNAEDISRFETGTPFQRAFTMFYSYFNMLANLQASEYSKTVNSMGLKKGAGRLFALYFFGFMLPAVLSEAIMKAAGGDLDEDDDDQYLDDFIAMFFNSQSRLATAMVPGLGPLIQSGISAANDKWYDDKLSVSPIVSVLENAVKGNVENVYKSIHGKSVAGKKVIKDFLSLLTIATGLPAYTLSKPLGYIADVSEGKTKPSGPVDFTRGIISGRGPKK